MNTCDYHKGNLPSQPSQAAATTIDDDTKRERMQRILAQAAASGHRVSTAAHWFDERAEREATARARATENNPGVVKF